jgi:hypothetical protein
VKYASESVTKKQKQEEWVQDIDARQRNVVFPDTATNEARFWRNLYEGKQKLTAIQAVGLALFAFMVVALFVAISLGWGHELYPTWVGRIESAALDWILVFAILGGFMLLVKWGTRQGTKRR